MKKIVYVFFTVLFFSAVPIVFDNKITSNQKFYRSYICEAGKCARSLRPLNEPPSARGSSQYQIEHSTMAACRLSCDEFGNLWPVPTGKIDHGYEYTDIHPSLFTFNVSTISEGAQEVVNAMKANFLSKLRNFLPEGDEPSAINDVYNRINVNVRVDSSDLTLDWSTDESYTLDLNATASENSGDVRISSQTVYGARHGLETLLQLTAPVIRSDNKKGLVIIKSATITDSPVFRHRGLTLDTSRNFVPIKDIIRTIDGLSSCKMNVLHWHATDSQSFPLEIKRVPAMSQYGAYSPEKIYSTEDMKFIVSYGRLRGVRVILEFDAPSHSGAGWEWGEESGLGSLAVCVNAQPWRNYCIQPPCGQLNPVNPNLYNVLRDIYKDFIDIWGKNEVFHMGGDEVFVPCWNSTKEITEAMRDRGMGRSQSDFIQLWSDYQNSVLKIVDEERGPNASNVSAILWSSDLTNPWTIERYLDPKRYVIHTWVESSSPMIEQLLNLGYRLIVTTKNAWYLDHGVWGSTKYYTWKKAYVNQIPRSSGILGGEVAMWGEYVDGRSFDPRIWPRTAAAAERLWSDPTMISTAQAEPRLFSQSDRLTSLGIGPDKMAPEWCAQHDGQCQ